MIAYNKLLEEREAILEEIERYKKGYVFQKRMGLWNNSDYLSELLYIKQKIESEILHMKNKQ